MRVWIVIAGLAFAAPAQALFVECPDGPFWSGSDIADCPCCIDCGNGTFLVEGDGTCDNPDEFKLRTVPPRPVESPEPAARVERVPDTGPSPKRGEVFEPIAGEPVKVERFPADAAPEPVEPVEETDDAMPSLRSIAFMLVALWAYFWPLLIARNRKHPQVQAIGALNLLAGWTGLGWVGALVWSVMAFEKPRDS